MVSFKEYIHLNARNYLNKFEAIGAAQVAGRRNPEDLCPVHLELTSSTPPLLLTELLKVIQNYVVCKL